MPPQRIPADLDAQAGLYRSLLAGRRMLVVLDNARDADQVRPLLPGAPGCLVAGHQPQPADRPGRRRGRPPAHAGPAHRRPRRASCWPAASARHRVAAEPDAVDEIIARCARLPLALAIVAARAATHPQLRPAGLADELRDARDRPGRVRPATTRPPTCGRCSPGPTSALSPAAARLFRLLGLHPGPDIAAAAAASLAGLPARAGARRCWPSWPGRTCSTEHAPGRYAFHDLLRAYAAELAHSHRPRRRSGAPRPHRMLDHYLHTAYAADRLLEPAPGPDRPRRRPSPASPRSTSPTTSRRWPGSPPSTPVLLAAVDHAAATGFDAHAWQLAWTLADFLDRRGHWHDLAAAQQAALAAAGRLADPPRRRAPTAASPAPTPGWAAYDDAHAHLQHALDLYRQTRRPRRPGPHPPQPRPGCGSGRAATPRRSTTPGRPSTCTGPPATGAGRPAPSTRSAGTTPCSATTSRPSPTASRRSPCSRSSATATAQAATWDSLGYAHHHLGHHAQAITCYQQALDLFRDLGDRYDEADTLTHLGDTHHAAGDPDAARDAWQQALTILDELDHPDADARPRQTPPPPDPPDL